MTVIVSKRKWLAVLATLLVVSLSTAAMPVQWLYDGIGSRVASKKVVCILRPVPVSASTVTNILRNRFKSASDLFKIPFLPGQAPTFFVQKSRPLSFSPDTGALYCLDQTATPVRAPPGFIFK